MNEKKLCKQCGKLIFNKLKNAKYCKNCSLQRKKVQRLIYNRKYARKNRQKLTNFTKEVRIKNKEIISLLRIKYGVRTYGDILEKLRKEV